MRRGSLFAAVMLLSLGIVAGCGSGQKESGEDGEVVVYTAVDEVFSERILDRFEEETGIKVKAVYDTESNKTTGLVNRIAAESEHPLCDVFWNNEFMQTIDLAERGLLEAYASPEAGTIPDYYKSSDGLWTAYGGRARVFLVNKGLLSEAEYPASVFDFVSGRYKGEMLAIAYPMFGTTKTMAAALYAQLGEEAGRGYFEDVAALGVKVVDGNSVTKDMAASGEAAIGFTDSDDAREAVEDGADVAVVYPDQGEGDMGTLLTPGTVALVKGAPHEANARKLIDFLLSERIERELVEAGFFDLSIRDAGKAGSIKGMTVSLEEIYRCMDVSAADMEEIFSAAR